MKRQPVAVFRRLAIGFFGIGLAIALVSGVHRYSERQASQPDGTPQTAPSDPISEELGRCSALTNEEAMDDERCQRAWILNRQRFFGQYPELIKDPEPEEDK